MSEPDRALDCFCFPGAIKSGRVEGIGIEFVPEHGEPWYGSFSRGDLSPNAVSFAGDLPAKTKAVVVSRGEGYVVDAERPSEWYELPLRPVMGVLNSREHGVCIVWDFVRMMCLDQSGTRWKTPSISWDGIGRVAVEGTHVVAEVWDSPNSCFGTARIALNNGKVTGGSSPEMLRVVT